ncbi:hypothetical protein CYG48_02405 [Neorhizobium sp. SOG26]|uniref:hypothetical protein n=1 Tax=Neorhizobium sp. SOG26 TaxID=2060726 RepID=UPI000E56A3C4|nr:hypothetical protein [Neorhizobium sp. SOG26]AXV14659.1 hypothetical protein CYG48_02405 [Neorhizobium sp. SOG26]
MIKGENPTFSYYIEQRLRHLTVPAIVRSLDDRLDDLSPEGLFVILVRYAKPTQIRWLKEVRARLAGVALLIDDDLRSVVVGPDGSLRYKANLLRLGVLPLVQLNALLSHVWTSTGALAEVLGGQRAEVQVLHPLPPALRPKDLIPSGRFPTLRIVYHATGIHRQEHAFLQPIIRRVLNADPALHFEVLADGSIANGWHNAGLPIGRYTVRKTMRWLEYATWGHNSGADIALNPLLNTKTNKVRADTKRVDVARLGAAGLYSRCDVFNRCAVPYESHLPNDPDAWVSEILRLAANEVELRRAKQASFKSLEKMIQLADVNFPF